MPNVTPPLSQTDPLLAVGVEESKARYSLLSFFSRVGEGRSPYSLPKFALLNNAFEAVACKEAGVSTY